VALVIGNAAYDHLPRLATPVNDAQDICARLRSLQFDTACHFNVPDRIHVRQILQGFLTRAKEASVAVFYFVGHGAQVDGENYLLPTKVAPLTALDLVDEGLALTSLLKSLSEVRGPDGRGPLAIVIIDAARESTLDGLHMTKSRGLAGVEVVSSRTLLLLSAMPGKVARDTGGRNSLFARNLLRNLGQPGFTIDEEFIRTRDQVRQQAVLEGGNEQIPAIIGMLDTRLCVAGCERVDTASANVEVSKQLDEALRRIRELESERERNARERMESDQLVSRLEKEIRARETVAEGLTEKDRQKEAELEDLRAQLANARTNRRELDQMGAAVQKAKALQEANVRLSQEKQDAVQRMTKLQDEITAKEKNVGQAGEANRRSQEEIARLRAELDDARTKERALRETELRAKANDGEISSLRATIAQLRADQLQREQQYVEQQKRRDEENRKLREALENASRAQPALSPRPAEKPRPPPMPAGF
jgi:uncharacterized caspase-like protein